MNWNKNPFPVSAFFEKSLVLAYAVPKQQLEASIPECLSLDLFEDQWAFIAVAMVQTRNLRPTGLPAFLGRDFILIGYRIFVRYQNLAGRNLRGLYIVGSQTDRASMVRMGNLLTSYRYEKASIDWQSGDGQEQIQSSDQLNVVAATQPDIDSIELPPDSPFSNWREARRFAGPMPFTFSYEPSSKSVGIVEGVRSSWTPEPMKVISAEVPFWDRLGIQQTKLANAFVVKNVPYHWQRGKVEKWQSLGS